MTTPVNLDLLARYHLAAQDRTNLGAVTAWKHVIAEHWPAVEAEMRTLRRENEQLRKALDEVVEFRYRGKEGEA